MVAREVLLQATASGLKPVLSGSSLAFASASLNRPESLGSTSHKGANCCRGDMPADLNIVDSNRAMLAKATKASCGALSCGTP